MTTHNSDKDIKQLIDNAGLKQLTKDRLNQVYTDMMEAEKRERCSGLRWELQGMINTLQTEGIISLSELDCLGTAFGNVWKARDRAFYIASHNK